MFWKNKKVIVTGGAGFLGSFVAEKLRQRGAQEIIVSLIEDCDLTQLPDIVIHLAAKVGGIGANREHPADFFYDNLLMGTQLIHES
jgi:GDP-L-fucose synthase